jgi:hypothetical protein
MPDKFILPNNSQRLTIVGRTGTGKTQAALWHLSKRDFDKRPWVIFDFKCDDHIDKIERAVEVSIDKPVPTKPGLYVVRPHPSQKEEVNEYLWKIWAKENIGVYADEGYMIPNPDSNNAFQACLTQGRSKKIPMIILSQRPVWMSRFVFSEADFFQIFALSDRRDYATVQQLIPREKGDITRPLPTYHSYYYNVGKNSFLSLSPVPEESEILERIHDKLKPVRGKL